MFFIFEFKISTLRIDSTNFLNSFGSKLAEWSGPLSFLSNVKCLSIILTPKYVEIIDVSCEEVWSERPIVLYFFCSFIRIFILWRYEMFKISNDIRRLSENEKLQYKNDGYITGLPVFAN